MIRLDKTGGVRMSDPVEENRELHFEDLFIKTCCTLDPDSNVKSRDLYEAYKEFCTQLNKKPLSINTFVKNLKKHGYRHLKIREGKNKVSYFMGLRLYEKTDSDN